MDAQAGPFERQGETGLHRGIRRDDVGVLLAVHKWRFHQRYARNGQSGVQRRRRSERSGVVVRDEIHVVDLAEGGDLLHLAETAAMTDVRPQVIHILVHDGLAKLPFVVGRPAYDRAGRSRRSCGMPGTGSP
jgi:hypothetical protein